MAKLVEKNVAELIMIGMVVMILLSSCGSAGYCMQSEWATPLSKRYSKTCY